MTHYAAGPRGVRRIEPRALAAEQFTFGAAAQDADDRIICDYSTGALLYDSDGIGGAAAVQFADLTAGVPFPEFNYWHFLVV